MSIKKKKNWRGKRDVLNSQKKNKYKIAVP